MSSQRMRPLFGPHPLSPAGRRIQAQVLSEHVSRQTKARAEAARVELREQDKDLWVVLVGGEHRYTIHGGGNTRSSTWVVQRPEHAPHVAPLASGTSPRAAWAAYEKAAP